LTETLTGSLSEALYSFSTLFVIVAENKNVFLFVGNADTILFIYRSKFSDRS
jgi:hypothetical protein